jgi:hypothetical protein
MVLSMSDAFLSIGADDGDYRDMQEKRNPVSDQDE